MVALYLGLTLLAHLGRQTWAGTSATFLLIGLMLMAGLRQRPLLAGCSWLLAGVLLLALDLRGEGQLALDAMPVLINLALGLFFARTLQSGSEPLIARVIEALEGRSRLASPGVADYARRLTWAWVILFAVQAVVLCGLIAGQALGTGLPAASRWYLHLGSFALVPAFLVVEYAFRRWHLRHLPHPSLPHFLISLVRCWPALARSLVNDTPRAPP